MAKEKKYAGYGYYGGGRRKMAEEDKVHYKSFSINVSPEFLDQLRKIATDNKTSVNKVIVKAIRCFYKGEFIDIRK